MCYLDGGWRISVTMAAVCMGVKDMGCEQGTGVHTMASKSGMRAVMHMTTVEQSKKG